jgi:sugar phosphate isomerase/epimerase
VTDKLYISAEFEFEEFIEVAKKRNLGFEIQEFCFPQLMDGDWKKRLAEYQRILSGFRGGLSLHNAFMTAMNVSGDPAYVELTRRRYDFHFMIAAELGAKIIVSHFNWLPFYRDVALTKWQEEQAKFWDHYVNMAEKQGLLLVTENIYEPRPEILKPVFDRINSERFKFIFDIGHANIISEVPIEEWVAAFGRDLVYMHAHNNYGNYDQHNSVRKGTINFDYTFKLFEKYEIAPIISTEVFEKAGMIESIDYLEGKIDESQVYRRSAGRAATGRS